jgi:hypothetical protein
LEERYKDMFQILIGTVKRRTSAPL